MGWIVRFVIRVLGVGLMVAGLSVGVFAAVGYGTSSDSANRFMAYAVGGAGVLGVAVGMKLAASNSGRRDSSGKPAQIAARGPGTSSRFDDFAWGKPRPSRNQFAYAMLLGVRARNGMTKHDMTDAIDEAKQRLSDEEPASEDQLATISEYHGVVSRQLTAAEADRIIDFLEQHSLPCPFCRKEVFAMDDSCCECGKSLGSMRIAVEP